LRDGHPQAIPTQKQEAFMSNVAMAVGGEAAVTRTDLGWKFIQWGLSLFIVGFLTGYIPILHYIVGGQAGNVEPLFLKNMTLWWGCPGILAELTLKTGSLGMIAIGLCYLAANRQGTSSSISSNERIAPVLCACGLIAELVTAGAGYAICVYIWGNFYFGATEPGKSVWIGAQGLSIAVYVIGVFYGVAGVRRAAEQRR
jgi:hypothetical protein